MSDIDDGNDPENQPIPAGKWDTAREIAKERYATHIDEDTNISVCDESQVELCSSLEGFWVEAWVFVPMHEVDTRE